MEKFKVERERRCIITLSIQESLLKALEELCQKEQKSRSKKIQELIVKETQHE